MSLARLVDHDRIDDVVDGDGEFEIELASLYVETATRYVEEMAGCLLAEDGWAGPAHALKGASFNFGAIRMGELAQAAEQSRPDDRQLAELRIALEATGDALAARAGKLRSS